MFYSHEVLTDRKYGVATVWLVATLGSKSALKRVSRKAILDVDVQKACETIGEPEAPMALRLSSNLLYGVARVYNQQCGYVLNDAETAKNQMRAMFKTMKISGLEDEGGHKGRSDQLVLQEDPNFLPDVDLLPVDLDQLNLDVSTLAEDSLRSTLSPHNSQISLSSQPIGGLPIRGVSSSAGGGSIAGGRGFSMQDGSGFGARAEPAAMLEDDFFEVAPDGTMLFSDARQPVGPVAGADRTDLGSVSSQIRREHAGGRAGQDLLGQPDDDGFITMQDDYELGHDAQAFPPRQQTLQDDQQEYITSETVEAPMRRRQKPPPKIIAPDTTLELRNGDLARWNTDYVANMQEALRHKLSARATAIAKKNAEHWILGNASLTALYESDRLVRLPGPLEMFSGAKLLETFTGLQMRTGGEKRDHLASTGRDDQTEGPLRKRSRGNEPSSDELGRGADEFVDGYMPTVGDDYTGMGIEQGREAPTPLDERHLSGTFPWNQSAGSRRPTSVFGSASLPGTHQPVPGGGLASRRGSRLQTASPLLGRGQPDTDTDQLPHMDMRSDLGGLDDLAMTGLDDFELYGPAAHVDTQTAAQSQWQRAALDSESTNFFSFVRAAIAEADEARAAAALGDEEMEEMDGTVEFATLLPPEHNTNIVAAQGLLHVLALGTKHLLNVQQEEAFGPIVLRPIDSTV
ncbi:hypothetical protein KC343_g6614 [Hortaea werneckii]|uniref:Rad21/Rec8-like protein N-terminal domain-containing protein n=1 Tax=Hortaea werneckii TaxID=91943 RepID=A0A3M7GJY1_HORWE|nr:hypothetical protein KC352_g17813 [Hortaea werneckii]KAI7562846.1 hypothetical protein KC317_g8138 [Hortaea werneckii]KAI7612779.1 hypothetical protein KC346_g7649 [Hortaea werneckii]KAI7625569.1 hypothetical protein KC343_g6614 [Hortaea werneckii]KAI7675581.1 hypothetical protein KC319_g4546 [Hortaea werneckii]